MAVQAKETSSGPLPSAGSAGVSELFAQNVKDAYFDLDSSDLRDDARDALTKDAEFLRSYSNVHVSIEGHCDERGSTEYNLGLGQRRAAAAKNYLISLGISADRIDTTSWGKERPFLHRADRGMLAAKSPRALRPGPLETFSQLLAESRPTTEGRLSIHPRERSFERGDLCKHDIWFSDSELYFAAAWREACSLRNRRGPSHGT